MNQALCQFEKLETGAQNWAQALIMTYPLNKHGDSKAKFRPKSLQSRFQEYAKEQYGSLKIIRAKAFWQNESHY
jgi:hypothetical protein